MQTHKFTLEESHFIDEIQATLTKYHHPSGLKVVKISNDDPQNVASILFQTIPDSSNGCAHVLEHTVLCGSKKFDVKDPFFSMLRRSVAGFANAFTGSDFTCYPFAAHIKEDFFHLFDVYLDAVFHPLLDKGSFYQEGSRLTHEGYKGIVFNEMKQAHSSLYDRFHHQTLEHLFPNTPYRFDSGGIPKEIVTLTHQQLLDFHKKYYHPSNTLLFLYGNLDVEEQFPFIEKSIEKIPAIPPSPLERRYQPRFKEKLAIHTHYPASSEEKATHLTIGFIIGDQKNAEDLLEAAYLKMLLADHDACPIQRAIMGANLASSVEVLTDTDVLEPYLYFIFKDVVDSKKLIETFDTTLKEVYEEGFDSEAKAAALHQLKISFLNTVEDGYPTGLILFFRAFLPSLNGANPLQMLQFKERIEILEKRMQDDHHIQKQLEKIFLKNTHRVEIHFSPKEHLLETELPPPPAIDPHIEAKIAEETRLIEKKQAASHDASILPILHIDQLPAKPTVYNMHKIDGLIPTYIHNTWTNGLSYIDLFIDLPHMSHEELPYLGLLTHLLGEIGTKNHPFDDLIEKKESLVSSFQFSIHLIDQRLLLSANMDCLSENIQKAFHLLEETLCTTTFTEKERIQEILKDLLSHFKSSFSQRGVGRCVLKTKSELDSGFAAIEKIKGFSFYFWLKKELELPLEHTLKGLEAVFKKLLVSQGLKELTCTTDLSKVPQLILPIRAESPIFTTHSLKGRPQFFGFATPLQAAENALSFPSFTFFDPMAPIARIVVQLVKHLELHPRLREKNGAYGASMSIDLDQGIMTMYTSCDPNIDLTYEIFSEVLLPILEGKYTEQDLYEAKLAALQKTEGVTLLSQRATHQYFLKRLGRTEEVRMTHRKHLIDADTSVIKKCVTIIMGNLTDGIAASIASKKALEGLKNQPTTLVEL